MLRRQKRASGTTNALKPVIGGNQTIILRTPPGAGIDAQGVVDGLLIGVNDGLPSQVGFVLEWIQEIYPELVKIAHVPGNDRQPVRDGRRGDHGVLHQSV